MSTLKVDSIVDGGGSGAPTAPNGLTVGTTAIPTSGALSNRNMIINGGFTVWQRGTSGSAGSGFTIDAADRWYSVRGALSKETENSMPYAHMTHGNYADSCYINHRLEDFAHTLGKQVTLSFKIKSDDGLGADGGVFVRYYTSSNNYAVCQPQTTFTYGSTWTTVTYSFTMPTNTPKGAGYGLEFFLYGDLNSVNNNGKTFDIKEVQFELGDTATPFEHRSYGDELARCKRYYQKIIDGSEDATQQGPMGTEYSSGNNNFFFQCIPEMRAVPAGEVVTGTSYYRILGDGNSTYVSGSTFSVDGDSSAKFIRFFESSPLNGSNGSVQWLRCNNASAYIALDAEL